MYGKVRLVERPLKNVLLFNALIFIGREYRATFNGETLFAQKPKLNHRP